MKRTVDTLLCSCAAACTGSIFVGLLEGLYRGGDYSTVIGIAGFSSLLWFPFAFIVVTFVWYVLREFTAVAVTPPLRSRLRIFLPCCVAALGASVAASVAGNLLVLKFKYTVVWALSVSIIAVLVFVIGWVTSIALSLYWTGKREPNKQENAREKTPSMTNVVAVVSACVALYAMARVIFWVAVQYPTKSRQWSTVNWSLFIAVFFSGLGAWGIVWLFLSLNKKRVARFSKKTIGNRVARVSPEIRLFGITAIVSLILVVVIWKTMVYPYVGYINLNVAYYGGGLFLASCLGFWIISSRRRWHQTIVVSAICSQVTTVLFAFYLRAYKPVCVLNIWDKSDVATLVIDRVFDIHAVRDDTPRERYELQRVPDRDLRPNVVLVTIDTLRADITPFHNGRAKMPALGALAESGVVFDWAFSPGNVTRRSLPAISLGLDALNVRGRPAGWGLRLDPRHVTLSDRLRAGGYATAAYFCCESLIGANKKLGMHWGFDEVVVDGKGMSLGDRAAAWIRAYDQPKPFFLWVHFLEPHNSNPKKKVGRWERYTRAVELADRQLAKITDVVNKYHRDTTVLVVSSDHGEGLGEHDQISHASDLYNSQLHVPLVISGAGIPTKRISWPIGLVDLAPTILDISGFVVPDDIMDGESLMPALRGDANLSREVTAYMIRDRHIESEAAMIVQFPYKLIEWGLSNKSELYNIKNDPKETRDIAGQFPLVVASLRKLLDRRKRLSSTF